jgi:hypothetical protein
MPLPTPPEPELRAPPEQSDGTSADAANDPSKGTSPKTLLFAWWCGVCHRREPFTLEDLVRFTRAGWPVCCGQTVLGSRVEEPDADPPG